MISVSPIHTRTALFWFGAVPVYKGVNLRALETNNLQMPREYTEGYGWRCDQGCLRVTAQPAVRMQTGGGRPDLLVCSFPIDRSFHSLSPKGEVESNELSLAVEAILSCQYLQQKLLNMKHEKTQFQQF